MTVNPASIPPHARHRYAIRVYFEDTDASGVVYHATYLRFAERARTEALRDLVVAHADMVAAHQVMFMVRGLEVDYERAAKPDDLLTVETAVLDIGGATVRLRQTVLNDTGVCATLRVRLACVRTADGRPGRIPPRWRAALAGMMDKNKGDTGR